MADAEADRRDARDAELRALVTTGAFEQATEQTIRAYGPELVSWLCAVLPGEADAHDAFSWLSLELWKSLARYDGRCSLRTWCYMLARQAAARLRGRASWRREVLVSEIPSVAHAVTHVWSTTKHGAQRARDVYAQIRSELAEEDQLLLVLRVDRNLVWRDIAVVLLGEAASADELARKAAALRKQFERVKERLRELAAKHE
jgi:RNA polymerase sigma-70 factor, ECF subfamily